MIPYYAPTYSGRVIFNMALDALSNDLKYTQNLKISKPTQVGSRHVHHCECAQRALAGATPNTATATAAAAAAAVAIGPRRSVAVATIHVHALTVATSEP